MDLVEQVYRLTRGFPAEEAYGLTAQMRRAAVSIPSNIAEGNTRQHSKEYLHRLSVAHASLAELQTQLEVVMRLEYLSTNESRQVFEGATSLAKQL